jgi:DNA topoisomerase-1
VRHFNDVLNVSFTADMEEQLDKVEEGTLPWREAVGNFYRPFLAEMDAAKKGMQDFRKEIETVSGVHCDACGSEMVVKWGRMGKFLACPKYPECKSTKPLEQGADGALKVAAAPVVDEVCSKCGKRMVVKHGRFGAFLACPGYPACKNTKPMASPGAIACPKCGEGHVAMRRSKKGRGFFGCDRYPACDFVSWDKPLARPCPVCGANYLVEKSGRGGTSVRCAAEACGFKEAATAAAAS